MDKQNNFHIGEPSILELLRRNSTGKVLCLSQSTQSKLKQHLVTLKEKDFLYSIEKSGLFINKYIFPNMRVWNYDVIPEINTDLKTINRWYLNGSNYSKTLRNWLMNFDLNQAKVKDLDYGMDYAKFCRMWRFYLLLCISHFDGCNGEILGNGKYLLVRT